MIRLGLDLHGVIDVAPKTISFMSRQMRHRGHEVYIVTGREVTEELNDELQACGMKWPYGQAYDGILSITTYQKDMGTPITYLNDDKTQPMMDPQIWNASKAMLCASAKIDIMIDDSTLYEPYFRDIKTQYIIYTPAVMEFLNFLLYTAGGEEEYE